MISLRTGKSVDPLDDPEEWARNLPSAYRSGDLVAVIQRDDRPPALDVPIGRENEPAIPDPPPPDTARHANDTFTAS